MWFQLECFTVYALLLSLPSAAQDSLYGESSFFFHNCTFTSKINSPYLDSPTNYDTLEAGVGYRLSRHRMDVRLGFMCHHNCRDNFIQGNYYYNIIEGNKASIFVTGGLISVLNGDSGTGIDLGVGTTINLSRDTYLDIECSTMANYRPLPIHIRFGWRFHI
ncbi:hypothetical protein [Orientia tsutsugamushi]|uniref:hypothetical protein n=1 Tax=Orientia tsutsugamushi TaxID=784 RepID=UPI003593BC64